MSKNDETASSAAPAEQSTDSVFDFLYHDARRVGSFLAQMDPSGHLTAVKQTENANSASGMKFSAHAGAGVGIAKGGGAFEDQRTAGEQQSAERTYDPLWTNALALLDMLDERGMIRDGLESARIGQFVKVSGYLSVTDLTLWKGMWAIPALQEVLKSGMMASQADDGSIPSNNRADRRKQAAQAKPTPNPLKAQAEAALTLVGMLPHTIQAVIQQDNSSAVWCSLREDGLIVSASDLTLKHGVTVSGLWTVVGVLDALPNS